MSNRLIRGRRLTRPGESFSTTGDAGPWNGLTPDLYEVADVIVEVCFTRIKPQAATWV
jgi:hypothetical protein